MIVKPYGEFSVGSGSDWDWTDKVYDNIYTNYARTTGKKYFYRASLTPLQAEDFSVKIQWNMAKTSLPEATYTLGYGDDKAQTELLSVVYKPTEKYSTIPFDFSSDSVKRQLIEHANDLLIGIKTTKSSMNLLGELDFVVPDSKIWVGETLAAAVYVGTTKASAVYVGTTKVL